MGDAFVALDAEDRWLYVNAQAERMLGRSRKELIGQVVWDLYPEARGTAFEEGLRCARAERTQVAVADYIPSSGRWAENRIHPLPSGVLYIHFTDITQRKLAQERAEHLASLACALSEALTAKEVAEAILRAALPPLGATVGMVCPLSEDGNTVETLAAVGLPATELEPWRTFPADADLPISNAVRTRQLVVLPSPEEHDSAYPKLAALRAGSASPDSGVPVAVPLLVGGRAVGGIGLICPPERIAGEDERAFLLTVAGQCALALERARLFDAEREARGRAEREAHERGQAQEFAQRLIESTPDCIKTLDLDGTIQSISPRGIGLLEIEDSTAVIGKRWDAFFADHPQTVGAYRAALDTARERGTARFQGFCPTATGAPRWWDVAITPITGEDGAVETLLSVSRDITERTRSEQALRDTAERLRESQERLELAFESVHLGMWELDLRTGEQVWSGEQERLFGLDRGGFGGSVGSFLDCLHPDDRDRVADYARRSFADPNASEYEDEFRVVQPATGEVCWLYGRARIERDPVTGEALRVTGVNLDITERKQAEEELRRAAERGAVLSRLNTVLRSSFDPDEIEQAAVTILGEALGGDRCYMVAYHVAEDYSTISCEYRSRPDELPPMAGRYTLSNYDAVMRDFSLSPDAQVVGDVRLEAGLDSDAIGKMEGFRMRAYVRVPFYEERTLVGSMAVAVADTPRLWKPEEVELLKTAAAQVRAVVEAARAHKRLEEAEAKQRRIAETLQNAMLLAPPEDAFAGLRVGTHYEPAWDEALVGGDFYDALQLDDECVALICGDGTGKGLEAARYVSESLFVLRAYLRESPDPARALMRLNNYMIDGQRFNGRAENALAAVAVAVIDTRTGEARFAAGGAEYPFVVRAATARAEQVDVSGMVLGATPDTEYDSVSVYLSPGDLVVLTTDGTTEARNRQSREFFGYEGVLHTAEEVARETTRPLNDAALFVVERAKGFAGGKLGDDACVVIARLTGNAPIDATGTTFSRPSASIESS